MQVYQATFPADFAAIFPMADITSRTDLEIFRLGSGSSGTSPNGALYHLKGGLIHI